MKKTILIFLVGSFVIGLFVQANLQRMSNNTWSDNCWSCEDGLELRCVPLGMGVGYPPEQQGGFFPEFNIQDAELIAKINQQIQKNNGNIKLSSKEQKKFKNLTKKLRNDKYGAKLKNDMHRVTPQNDTYRVKPNQKKILKQH